MGSEAEGPLFQAMELPTPRPARYNSVIFKFHVFYISSFFPSESSCFPSKLGKTYLLMHTLPQITKLLATGRSKGNKF